MTQLTSHKTLCVLVFYEISLGHYVFRSWHPPSAIVKQFPITHQNGSYIRSAFLQGGCHSLLELSAVSLAASRLLVHYIYGHVDDPILTDWIT